MSGLVTALYRRYRSAVLGDLIGQEHIVRTLSSELRSGQLAHAYLFAGTRGTGKTSTARILARAVNCLDPEDGEPCNRCTACTEITDGSAVDVLEIDAASNRGIDEMRDLRERVRYLPARLRTKVYIIDEAHMLTGEAWNAFLKTLEEPPEHVLFVLCTTEPHKVPETVRSRVQRFDFHRVAATVIQAHLTRIAAAEGAEVDPGALRLVAVAAQGSVRDALSLLDQCLATGERPLSLETCRIALGLADPEVVAGVLRALAEADAAAALRGAASALEMGADPRQLLRECSRLARTAELYAVGLTEAVGADSAEEQLCRSLAARRADGFWLRVLEVMGATELELRQPVDARLQVEACLLRLCRDPGGGSAEAGARLEARVTELERRLASVPSAPTVAAPAPRSAPAAAAVPEGRHGEPPTTAQAAPEAKPAIGPAPPATSPASPAPTPAPDLDASSAAGSVPLAEPLASVAAWERAWPAVIDAVNHQDRVFAGVLRGCRPLAADPERLVVGSPYKWHLDQLRKKAAMLRSGVEAVAGGPREVGVEFCGGEPAGAEDAAQPMGPSLTDQVLSTFAGSRLTSTRLRDRAHDPAGEAPG
jgi:DNA polymerase-3 subunit gamma/tau